MILFSLVYVASFVAVLYFGRAYFAKKLMEEYHRRIEVVIDEKYAKRTEAIHLSHKAKNRALNNETKALLLKMSGTMQEAQVALLAVRQENARQESINDQTARLVQDLEGIKRWADSNPRPN